MFGSARIVAAAVVGASATAFAAGYTWANKSNDNEGRVADKKKMAAVANEVKKFHREKKRAEEEDLRTTKWNYNWDQ